MTTHMSPFIGFGGRRLNAPAEPYLYECWLLQHIGTFERLKNIVISCCQTKF